MRPKSCILGKMKRIKVNQLKIISLLICIVLLICSAAKADYVFGEPIMIPATAEPVGGAYPSISSDGLTMYLEVDGENWQPPAAYETDIGVMTRESPASPWSRPLSLGSTINSYRYDTSLWISTDG